MAGSKTPAATRGGVEVPIGPADVVAGAVAEEARGPVDGSGMPLELEEGADGGLVEVQVEVFQAESGAEFLIPEAGKETIGAKRAHQAGGLADWQFPFQPDLIAQGDSSRGVPARRGLGSQDGASRAMRGAGSAEAAAGRTRRRGFHTKAEKAAEAAKIAVRGIEDYVLLEDATARSSS